MHVGVGYHWNRLDEPTHKIEQKPSLTELAFIIDWRVVYAFVKRKSFVLPTVNLCNVHTTIPGLARRMKVLMYERRRPPKMTYISSRPEALTKGVS